MPSHYACGTSFTFDHSLLCPKGGFPSIFHNKAPQNYYQKSATINVEVEPLLATAGETFQYKTVNIHDGAWLDDSMNGFWGGRYAQT